MGACEGRRVDGRQDGRDATDLPGLRERDLQGGSLTSRYAAWSVNQEFEMVHRIETHVGLNRIADRLRNASEPVLVGCRGAIAEKAYEVLSRRGFASLDRVRELMRGDHTQSEVKAFADAADERYLRMLDEAEGNVGTDVLDEFSVARALAALVFLAAERTVDDVLEASYEICSISRDSEKQLVAELESVLKACTLN